MKAGLKIFLDFFQKTVDFSLKVWYNKNVQINSGKLALPFIRLFSLLSATVHGLERIKHTN